jgi:tripartite-type tricarboxylate transporter receptor subunit TctC
MRWIRILKAVRHCGISIRKENHMKAKRTFFAIFVVVAFLPPFIFAADEPFPNKPVNIIVPYAPGGTLDMQAKIIGDRLAEVLGQPFVRIHKPGGGGVLGTAFTAKAKPDGYTIVVATSSSIVLTPMLKKLDYSLEDFLPLGIYSKAIIRLYVKADSKYQTLEDFVREGKKRSIQVSSPGRATHMDIILQAFAKRAGIQLVQVPYKSCGEAMTALLGGHVEGDICTASFGQLEAGAVRILAASDHERSKFFPDVKTFKELGYPVSLPGWYTLAVPQGTPSKIVEKLDWAMQQVYQRHGEDIQKELLRMELVPHFLDATRSLQEFKRENETIREFIKELDIKG